MKLPLRNKILVAAGPWSSGEAYADVQRLAAAGAVVAKTVTRQARPGNPPPTEQRLAAQLGWLNRVGLRNRGARSFLDENLPRLLACGAPVMLSVYADTLDDLVPLIDALEPHGHAGYEFNASCPNLDGEPLSAPPLHQLLRGLRQRTARPIWVKLAYQPLHELRALVKACADAEVDALCACNTAPALDVSQADGTKFFGGLSGPALRPLEIGRAHV